ncbi:hypothetical protein AYJ66_17280 [Dietzia cinnamea]|nr:hypothetical protein AYJ66_17280 [Dietzia cinnamea]
MDHFRFIKDNPDHGMTSFMEGNNISFLLGDDTVLFGRTGYDAVCCFIKIFHVYLLLISPGCNKRSFVQ